MASLSRVLIGQSTKFWQRDVRPEFATLGGGEVSLILSLKVAIRSSRWLNIERYDYVREVHLEIGRFEKQWRPVGG